MMIRKMKSSEELTPKKSPITPGRPHPHSSGKFRKASDIPRRNVYTRCADERLSEGWKMAVTESQVAATELEKVIPKVRVLFERDDKFYAHIKKRDVEKISHRQMRVPLELRPGGAFHYFNPDGGDLGRGGGPTFDKAVLNCVFLTENIEYTKLTQWATDDARKSIINAVRRLTATALDEMRRQLDSQLMQAGDGVIGTVTTDTPAGGANVLSLTTDGFGARLMRYGQTVQVFDATLAINRGSGKITQHDVENKSVTITPQIPGVVAGDKIVTDGIHGTCVTARHSTEFHIIIPMHQLVHGWDSST